MPYDVADFKIDPLQLTTPRARLEYLRNFLQALSPERFYIGNYVSLVDEDGRTGAGSTQVLHNCGTAACIAGWAAFLFVDRPVSSQLPADDGESEAHRLAAHLLGLSEDEAYRLFVPLGWAGPWDKLSHNDAATVLDHLLATGEVDWSVAPSS